MTYERSQTVWQPFAMYFGVVVAILLLVGSQGASVVLYIVLGILVLGLVLTVIFRRLSVKVDDTRVEAAFGNGWPKKIIDRSTVTAVKPVRNKWWYGLGIRKVPRGWMYNVWGLDAVELELDSGKVFRIGTDDPEGLAAALSPS